MSELVLVVEYLVIKLIGLAYALNKTVVPIAAGVAIPTIIINNDGGKQLVVVDITV